MQMESLVKFVELHSESSTDPYSILNFKLVFQGFNWTRFIQGVLSSVSIKVQLEEEVVVYSSPYLEKMNDVLSKYSVRSVQEGYAKQEHMKIKWLQKSFNK